MLWNDFFTFPTNATWELNNRTISKLSILTLCQSWPVFSKSTTQKLGYPKSWPPDLTNLRFADFALSISKVLQNSPFKLATYISKKEAFDIWKDWKNV